MTKKQMIRNLAYDIYHDRVLFYNRLSDPFFKGKYIAYVASFRDFASPKIQEKLWDEIQLVEKKLNRNLGDWYLK